MTNSKIVKFPSSEANGNFCTNVRNYEQKTGNLFGLDVNACGHVVFIDVANVNEDMLARMILRNCVTSLIDLRKRPVFEKPFFHHRRMINFLYMHRVQYVEYGMFSSSKSLFTLNSNVNLSPEQALSHLLSAGLMLFLYDKDALIQSWVGHIRFRVSELVNFQAELHPRSLQI